MTEPTEDIISAENAGTLDGLMRQRIKRTPDNTAYRSYDADSKQWRDTSWGEVGEQPIKPGTVEKVIRQRLGQ